MSHSPAQSGAVLAASGITLSRAAATILDDVSITVAPESRIGLVGPNGVGKSTLLGVLGGDVTPDAGTRRITPPTASIGLLSQKPDHRVGESLRGYLARRTGVTAADAALTVATDRLGSGDAHVAEHYDEALRRWMALGGADFEARAAVVCAELRLPAELLDQETGTFSGGQAARASLAGVLLSRHDILLLDEPTNDLDLDGLDRLEHFLLNGRRGGLVVVSHDRQFLERVVDEVVEIDEHHHQTKHFRGGWQAYLDAREVDHRHAVQRHAEASTKRAELSDRVRTQRQWSENAQQTEKRRATDNDKFIAKRRAERTEKQASKVRASIRAIERLEHVAKPWEGWELNLDLTSASRSGDVVAELDDAIIERGTFKLGPISEEIRWGERVAVEGPNGSGKTTLLAALLGRLPLSTGTGRLGPSVIVGELDQARSTFLGDRPLIEAFLSGTEMAVSDARSLLAKFGLGADHVQRTAATLSPGERTRAGLALLMAGGTNCLVLDEPTNHLDLPAITQLEKALDTWEGTLLLVTHDRRLREHVRIDRSVVLRSP